MPQKPETDGLSDLDILHMNNEICEIWLRRQRGVARARRLGNALLVIVISGVILILLGLLFCNGADITQGFAGTVGGCATTASEPAHTTLYCHNPITGEVDPCRSV